MKPKISSGWKATWIITIIVNLLVFGAIGTWYLIVGSFGAIDDTGTLPVVVGIILSPIVIIAGILVLPLLLIDFFILIGTFSYLLRRQRGEAGVGGQRSAPNAAARNPSRSSRSGAVVLPPQSTEKAAKMDSEEK